MKHDKARPENDLMGKSRQVIPVGTFVLIQRPHLWSGAAGEIVTAYDDGRHRICIPGKDGLVCHTEARADTLKILHWKYQNDPVD